ncbi:MAG: N-acetyl-gamma-glutamyl-phosphate reductase, partial [Alicyclobacillus sp.]|nr:N-acetyl-gamma-glutamyl-phosphate reductase [Alicyclobacillus sp.]
DKPIATMFPHVQAPSTLRYERYDEARCADACDVVFVALPSGVSGQIAVGLWRRGKRVIDLSGDLRLPAADYATWYGKTPVDADAVAHAVYGLPELYRQDIRGADLVSNPGCYATAVLLGLLPVIQAGLNAHGPIIADAKSGVSGAGRSPATNNLLAELAENFYPYRVGRHQHVPEIERHLFAHGGGPLVLTTQLLPVVRGIYVSAYVSVRDGVTQETVQDAFARRYEGEPFVMVQPPQTPPALKHVRGSNACHVGAVLDERSRTLQVFSALDNLQKGAAGQAVQNLNLMCGWPETAGLTASAVYP